MRKKHLKKIRSREAFEIVRNTPNATKNVYDKKGNIVALNTTKHAMFMKEYKNGEYGNELLRDFVSKFQEKSEESSNPVNEVILKNE